jgi:hypothetical protein
VTIKNYDPVIAIIRSKLLANSGLTSWSGWTNTGSPDIYPAYISFISNGNYPALTVCREEGETFKNRTGYQGLRYYIHGWFKQSEDSTTADSAVDDAAFMLNTVVDILDVHPILGQQVPQFAMCRLVNSKCPVYDDVTRTTFFMTEWLIKANKNLIYS